MRNRMRGAAWALAPWMALAMALAINTAKRWP
jgi:hypothetical protein